MNQNTTTSSSSSSSFASADGLHQRNVAELPPAEGQQQQEQEQQPLEAPHFPNNVREEQGDQANRGWRDRLFLITRWMCRDPNNNNIRGNNEAYHGVPQVEQAARATEQQDVNSVAADAAGEPSMPAAK